MANPRAVRLEFIVSADARSGFLHHNQRGGRHCDGITSYPAPPHWLAYIGVYDAVAATENQVAGSTVAQDVIEVGT